MFVVAHKIAVQVVREFVTPFLVSVFVEREVTARLSNVEVQISHGRVAQCAHAPVRTTRYVQVDIRFTIGACLYQAPHRFDQL